LSNVGTGPIATDVHCPSLTIFGSFFPAWMLCAIVGVVVAGLAYAILERTPIGRQIRPAYLAYPSIALSVTFLLWLTLYGR
jgi:hypothetical protein